MSNSDARKRDEERRAEAERTVPAGVDTSAIRARAEARTWATDHETVIALCDEVERLRESNAWNEKSCKDNQRLYAQASDDLAAARATIARVEALADEFAAGDMYTRPIAEDIRAALTTEQSEGES